MKSNKNDAFHNIIRGFECILVLYEYGCEAVASEVSDMRGLGGGAWRAKMEAWWRTETTLFGAAAGYLGERSSRGFRPAFPWSLRAPSVTLAPTVACHTRASALKAV